MKPAHFLSRIDFFVVFIVLLVSIAGLLAVYSATYSADTETSDYFNKQLFFMMLGILLMITVNYIPVRILQKLAFPFYFFTILLLLLVLFFGVRGHGAERWLAVGSIKIQPSELAKLATVLAISKYLSDREANINRIKSLAVVSTLIIVPFLLIIKQPDLGTSLVFLALLIPLLFWTGLDWFALFVIVSPLLTALLSFSFYAFLVWMILILALLLISQKKIYAVVTVFVLHIGVGLLTPVMWSQLRPYQQQRILTFANPEADPQGAGYQIIQSQVAIGSGGIWGKGFLEGSQTHLKFLPAQHTDFIFSVIGEEYGFAGVLIILSLFFALLLYLSRLAIIVKSTFASTTLIGIVTILFFHIFVNIGMTIGLAPVTGLPLPLLSYGGSFLLSTFLMIGVALNLSNNRFLA
jgi:rod shape determining protein RodA